MKPLSEPFLRLGLQPHGNTLSEKGKAMGATAHNGKEMLELQAKPLGKSGNSRIRSAYGSNTTLLDSF